MSGHSYPARVLEWQGAALTMAWAVTLALPGDTLSLPGFAAFAEIMWAVLTFVIASVRMVALYVNGHWRRTPLLRALTAAIGAGLWFSMASLFHGKVGPLPPGVLVCSVLAALDVLSAWRSGRDITIAKRAWETVR
jgi:peptidoglycan/LPS O-acetylase OafA/YrhL